MKFKRSWPHLEHLLHTEAEQLTRTDNAQLSTFLTSLIVLDAVERLGVEPAAAAGHSLGEYTALVASGALAFEEGLLLVAERGAAMLDATTARVGTMAAVLGLKDDDVEVACARVDGEVWVANYNAPGQVVIAGDPEAVAQASSKASAKRTRRQEGDVHGSEWRLPHSLYGSGVYRLRSAIESADFFAKPTFPFMPMSTPELIPALSGPNYSMPSCAGQFVGASHLHNTGDAGATIFVELGPGNVLTGMAKRTLTGTTTLAVSTPEDLDKLLTALASPSESVAVHEGEHLFATERMVVSPTAGVFTPAADLAPGFVLSPGTILGRVGEQEVRSPFAGILVGVLAVEGERVTTSQPIAWLRSA